MNKVILHAVSLLLLGVSLSLQAQVTKIPPPTPPFVNNAPDHTTWKVTYAPKQAPPPSAPAGTTAGTTNSVVSPAQPPGPPKITEVNVVKMDQNRQDVYLWSDKKTTEYWTYNGLYLTQQPGNPDLIILPSTIANPTKLDFRELDWLSLGNYKSTMSYQQHQCYFFLMPASSSTGPERQAWIDVKTKLPVALDDGLALMTYAGFKEIPARELTLPPLFVKGLEDFQKSYLANYGKPWKP